MKPIQLLPLAYLADVHGFIYFVPYMLFILVIAQVLAISRRRGRKVSRATVRVHSTIIPVGAEEVVLAAVRS